MPPPTRKLDLCPRLPDAWNLSPRASIGSGFGTLVALPERRGIEPRFNRQENAMSDIERVEVIDYRALGKKIITWSKNARARPKDLREFEQQLKGVVKFPLPKWVKGLQFVQGNLEVLLIRLPPAELMEDTLKTARSSEPYPLPKKLEDFYMSLGTRGLPKSQSDKLAMLEVRTADYTIQCCA
jgi:hypothetical protein